MDIYLVAGSNIQSDMVTAPRAILLCASDPEALHFEVSKLAAATKCCECSVRWLARKEGFNYQEM